MYRILGKYHGRTEEIDCFANRIEAERMLVEYTLALGSSWTLWIE
jgi:hypothetical protein